MGNNYLVRLLGRISGSGPGVPIEYVIFNTVTFLGSIITALRIIFSIIVLKDFFSIIFSSVVFSLMATTFYFSRFKGKTKQLVFPFSLILFAAVFVNWFLTNGVLGPMPFAFFVIMVLSLSIRPSKKHFPLILLLTSLGLTLVFLQFQFPDLFHSKPTGEPAYAQHAFMFVAGFVFFGLLIGVMKSSFEKDRQLVVQKNEELSDFAHFVSNDLKAPLRGIQHLSRFVLEGNADNLDDTGKEMLEKVILSADRMRILIDDILTYTRASENMGEKEAIDMNELVEGIVAFLNPPKEVSIRYSGLPTKIYYNRIALHQVIQNLVTNAIKYNDKSKTIIEISANLESKFYWVSVKDNGPGIAPENQEKVFQFLKTLGNKSRGESGTGIGLALVKKIVEQNQGTIKIDSVVGQGATFLISIPA